VAGLIENLEALTAPSEEANAHVMWALGYKYEHRHIGATCWDDEGDTCCPGAKHLDHVWVDPRTDKWVTTAIFGFDFTSDVNMALRELETRLPEMRAALFTSTLANPANPSLGSKPFAMVMRGQEPVISQSYGFNLATALTVAVLRAMEKA
jgi:hypothetical protein